MKYFLQILLMHLVVFGSAQTYTHPTAGIAFEYVGACETATCSGTYYDNGGAGSNYSNNINGTYRIFCPNIAGRCLRATFNSFSIEGGGGCPYDLFRITNGSTQNSPILWSGCGTGSIGPFTGTANGCLGFRFWSDFTVTYPGWSVSFSCVNCANGPNGTDNNDCINATPVCTNLNVPGNSTGPGIAAEACGGNACPAGGENYSNWYRVSIIGSGTFTFAITPSVATDDYDYAVYGPNTTCGSLGPSIRCSDSGLSGTTGLSAAAGDLSENVNGDKYTAQMNVLAGQTYYIMIDEWTPTGAGYTLSFGGTAVISCSPLPVELTSFNATYVPEDNHVKLHWETSSETNNRYFTIEHSTDGDNFEAIGIVDGAGNSSAPQYYNFIHNYPVQQEINYYRLKQTDFDGQTKDVEIAAIMINDPDARLNVYPNPANEETTIEFNTAINNVECTIDIYDFSGRKILSYNFVSQKGTNIIPLVLDGFANGVHFVNIRAGNEVFRTAFVKK